MSDPALPLGLTEHHVCPREHERAVDECAICHRDNADGRAWDEEGVAVPACARHAGCRQVDGAWRGACAQCGGATEPGEDFCGTACWDAWIDAHQEQEVTS